MAARFDITITPTGEWDSVNNAFSWFRRDFGSALNNSLKKEASFLEDKIRDNLKGGGSPSFKPLAPFTKAVRRAMGISGMRPGIATKQVLNSIDSSRVGKFKYFAGVKFGKNHVGYNKTQDVGEIALILEMGRPKFYLELDKPGKTGKTPRQWLWWLYFSGAIKSPPGFKSTHIEIGMAPSRPFVGQVWEKEAKKSSRRVMDEIMKRFSSQAG